MASAIDLKDRLAAWRAGSAGFFRWIADVKPMIPSAKGGHEPYVVPSERVRAEIVRALDGGFGTVVWCWPRRHGKTVVSALVIVWRFMTRKTQTIAIVANSEKQSVDTAFKIVKTIIEQTPYTRKMIESGAIKVGADTITYTAAGNTIQGFASNPAALYGKKLSVAQVSELHAAKSDAVYQVLASSTIDTDDGLVLVDSTAGPRNSPLFALNQLAESGADTSLFFSYIAYRDLEDAVTNGPAWIKPERLRSRAAQMLPAEFSQQHLNQWTAGTNALFPAEMIERCREAFPLDVKALADGAAFAVGGGLDRAYGFSLHGDATVTSCVLKVLRGEEEHFFVLASESISFSSAGGIKRAFTRYQKDFGMKRAAIESYNSQDIAAWCGEQPFEHEVIHATPERQANAFTVLYNAASEGRLHIHSSFAKLFKEMETFEYRLEATGTSKGTLPRFEASKGNHDDHVYSLAWAIYSLRDFELNPYEVNGIHCQTNGPVVHLCILNGGKIVPPCAESCRSMQNVATLYSKYLDRAGIAPMKIEDFFDAKVRNIGSHTVGR